MTDVAPLIALYATGASLRDVARAFGLTKSRAYNVMKRHAPHLLDARDQGRKQRVDRDEVRRLTAEKKTRQQIADELGCGYDAVREAQMRMDIYTPTRVMRKRIDRIDPGGGPVPTPEHRDAYEPPLGVPIGEWPAGMVFTDAVVRRSIGFGRPRVEAAESGMGCAANLCAEA